MAKKALEDESDNGMEIDEERVGRKRKRSISDDEGYSELDEGTARAKTTSATKKRSMTPAQLKINARSILRSKSQNRREGSVP